MLQIEYTRCTHLLTLYCAQVLPESSTSNERQLQADDVSLAYDFAKKFPGYTAENLSVRQRLAYPRLYRHSHTRFVRRRTRASTRQPLRPTQPRTL